MAEYLTGQQPKGQRADRGDVAANIVAKRSAGAAQSSRKQLREVDGEAAEQSRLKEAHNRDHPKDVAEVLQKPERESGTQHGQQKRQGESGLAPDNGRPPTKGVNAEERTAVEN